VDGNWQERGRKLFEAQQWEAAVAAFAAARAQNPQDAAAVSSLAAALLRVGRIEEAETCAREAVALNEQRAASWANLGACLFELERWTEAAEAFRAATTREPRQAAHWSNLGEAEQRLGLWAAAQASFERSLAIDPRQVNAALGLATALSQQGRPDEGLQLIRSILGQYQQHAPAWLAAGNVLARQGKLTEAIDALRRASDLAPNRYEVRYNLGRVLFDNSETSEVEKIARELIRDFPERADGWVLLGLVQQHDWGQFGEAESSYRKALELNSSHVDAHWNLSHLMLVQGGFDEGWQAYEWRWKTGQLPPRYFRQPMWEGESLSGKTILLHAEQGLGDTIQFIRYASIVKRLGGRVIVECQKPLKKLLGSYRGIDGLVGFGEALPAFDCHAPFLSLPRILKTALPTIPTGEPYLVADETLVAQWGMKLENIRGYRIGINWHGRGGGQISATRHSTPGLLRRREGSWRAADPVAKGL
jgi:tetratricopeptide (TPR) repeat protein